MYNFKEKKTLKKIWINVTSHMNFVIKNNVEFERSNIRKRDASFKEKDFT